MDNHDPNCVNYANCDFVDRHSNSMAKIEEVKIKFCQGIIHKTSNRVDVTNTVPKYFSYRFIHDLRLQKRKHWRNSID
jgi:hypothetical protein